MTNTNPGAASLRMILKHAPVYSIFLVACGGGTSEFLEENPNLAMIENGNAQIDEASGPSFAVASTDSSYIISTSNIPSIGEITPVDSSTQTSIALAPDIGASIPGNADVDSSKKQAIETNDISNPTSEKYAHLKTDVGNTQSSVTSIVAQPDAAILQPTQNSEASISSPPPREEPQYITAASLSKQSVTSNTASTTDQTDPAQVTTTINAVKPESSVTDQVLVTNTTHTEKLEPSVTNPVQVTTTVAAEEPEPSVTNPILVATTIATIISEPSVTDPDQVSTTIAAEKSEPLVTDLPTQPPLLSSALPIKIETSPVNIGSSVGDVRKILTNLTVSTAQTNVQQTPIATSNGFLYTANIEHGPNGDANGYDLLTVLRKGQQDSNGDWSWKSRIVEDRTVHDKWHTAPSVAVDKLGKVHIVYNMHNFPWQYKRSSNAHDIDSLEFYGQYVTDEEIRRSKEENKTSFPTLGKAQIPGNQVTYPAFYKDKNNDLYVSYRFGATPNQSFSDRTMSAGVSVYNTVTQTWSAIGGDLALVPADFSDNSDAGSTSIAVAAMRGWTSYHPRLVFGKDNRMFVNWFWRSGTAGAKITRPCMLYSDDRRNFKDATGANVTMPATPNDCSNMEYSNSTEFYSVGNTTIDSLGRPHILLSPENGARQILHYSNEESKWIREDSPSNATEIFFDEDDNLWAVANGIRIYLRLAGQNSWTTMYDDSSNDNCYPKAQLDETMSNAFIHVEGCDSKSISIYGLRLK